MLTCGTCQLHTPHDAPSCPRGRTFAFEEAPNLGCYREAADTAALLREALGLLTASAVLLKEITGYEADLSPGRFVTAEELVKKIQGLVARAGKGGAG